MTSPRRSNRWSEAGAKAAIERWGAHGAELALRVYSSRLIGDDTDLVLHGGGNTSVKGPLRTLLGDEVDCLWVKGSGSSLDKVEPRDFPALDLAYLRRLRALDALSDEEMVNQLRTHLFDASSPNPSVEALLHAFLPHTFVDHSHADAVLVLTNQPNGEALVREALGSRVAILPYIMPGFPLAKAVAEVVERAGEIEGVVLIKHGLFSFGKTAKESYDRHIELVVACEALAEQKAKPRASVAVPAGPSLAEIAPVLRGLLAFDRRSAVTPGEPPKRLVMDHRGGDDVLAALADPAIRRLASTGTLTPDHVIRTKAWPLLVDRGADLSAAVTQFRERYDAYFERAAGTKPEKLKKLDSAPRVVLIPGVGALCFGKSKAEAMIAADITEHTLRAKRLAESMAGYESLPDGDLFDMEYWSLEQAKLGKAAERPLDRQVALVTGAAGAIGRGVCDALAEAGAALAFVDRDETALAKAVLEHEKRFGKGSAIAVTADVSDDDAMRRAFDRACEAFGGVDVVVPNAGIALVRPIAELSAAEARRVSDVNYIGVLTTLREAGRVFRAQGTGGSVIVSASKNVFAPGKDFGAYSASKAAALQIAKIAAIELAPLGVTVNAINADAVFAHGETPSGLWQEVGPDRAKSRGLTMAELEEFYRKRNLLHVKVEAKHVGAAVVFFASQKTPTTGATLPVDGGIAEAFPR